MTTDTTQLQRFARQLARRGERRLVLVEGERAEALAWVRQQLAGRLPGTGLWTGPEGERPHPELTPVAANGIRAWLGRELDLVIWDGWSGNPPDALAAVAGALRAGGLLFWLMPPLPRWGDFADPDYARTGLDGASYHPFAARMARILAASAEVIRVTCPCAGPVSWPQLPSPAQAFRIETTTDQARLVRQLVRFGLGRRRRPLVVTADRGRGKSAALGMAAAELTRQGRKCVLVTAPSADSIRTLMRHARETLGGELACAGPEQLTTRSGAQIRYLAVTDLLTQRPEAEVLMVDEAASIPPDRLRALLLGWPRVAFCSTVHGYEGTGRGFAIRFRAVLDRHTPHWQGVTLSQPIRWAGSDPLEPLINRLFLLSAPGADPGTAAEAKDIRIERWRPARAPEAELEEAFGLLVDAHYRTTPADLRQWLDDPAALTWCARRHGRIVGLLWAAREGGLPESLAEAVTLGQRRVRGHLLAQSLACHSGFAEAAVQRLLRVVRIAVAAPLRRAGIGRQLVAAAVRDSRAEGIDMLGTSFGGSSELLRFWQACGLMPVRVGFRREASSGEYPLQMAAALSDRGGELVRALRERLAEHWLSLLPRHWQDMPADLVAGIGASLPAGPELNEADWRDLQGFAWGHRGFDLCWPVLRKWSRCPDILTHIRHSEELSLWMAAVLQGRSWQQLQQAGLCCGRRDGETRLRALVRTLLTPAADRQ